MWKVLSLTDALVLLLAVAALAAPVAHLIIAYLYAPRQVTRWLESPRGLEAALGRALPILGAQLGAWSETEEGKAFLGHLVEGIVVRGKAEAQKMLMRSSGHASQQAMPPLMRILGGIKTGNPTMDGMWAMVAPLVLPRIAPSILRAMPQLAAGLPEEFQPLPEA